MPCIFSNLATQRWLLTDLMKKAIAVFSLLLAACLTNAQSGTLDPAWSINGKLTASLGFSYFRVSAGCVQRDGKILVGGAASNRNDNPSADFALTRFNADGSLDEGFGTKGIVYTRIRSVSRWEEIRKVIELPDGRILTGGVVYEGYTPLLGLCRYKSNGEPDSSFNGDGTYFGINLLYASMGDMALQADGKIVVSTRTGSGAIQLFRFHPDGRVDGSLRVTPFPVANNNTYSLSSLSLLADGKILAAGSVTNHTMGTSLLLARFQPDGRFDSSFASNGMHITSLNQGSIINVSMSINSDSTLNVSTMSFKDSGNVLLLRFTKDGALDASFGSNGVMTYPRVTAGFYHVPSAEHLLQPDGKMLFAGSTHNSLAINQFSALRVNADGSIDNSFGNGGVLPGASVNARNETVFHLLQPDGKLIACGYYFLNGRFTLALRRFLPNGQVDQGFAAGQFGYTIIGKGNWYSEVAQDMLVHDDGRILTAGYSENDPFTSIFLAQFTPGGAPDPAFGMGGVVYQSHYESPDLGYDFYRHLPRHQLSVRKDHAGNIYVLAPNYLTFQLESGVAVFKFKPNGDPDTDFGWYGKRILDISPGKHEEPIGFVVQSDGKLVVAGSVPYLSEDSAYVYLVRINAQGGTDSSFGTNGVVIENLFTGYESFGINNYRNMPQRLALQPDGKIILTGEAKRPLFVRFALRRYHTDGKPDNSFGGSGFVVTPVIPSSVNYATSVVVQPDGKVLVGGITSTAGMVLARYQANGALDYSFGTNGVVKNIALWANAMNKIMLLPDEKIVMLGEAYHDDAAIDESYIEVARLNANGVKDSSFGYNGVLSIATTGLMQDVAGSMALQPNGRLLVCGATKVGWEDSYSGYGDLVIYGLTNCSVARPAVTAQGNTSICTGDQVTLQSSASTGNQWYRAGVPLSGATGGTYTATESGDYSVIVKGSGCSSNSSVPVSVMVNFPPFPPTLSVSGATTVCEGSSVLLSSSVSNGNQWYKDGTAIAGATGGTYAATQSGSYTVRQVFNGCSSLNSNATSVVVNPAAPTPVITLNGNVLTSSVASFNQWYKDGVAIPGATGQTYTATVPGNYQARASTVFNCSSGLSNVIAFVVTAINSPDLDNKLLIGPNPTADQLFFQYKGSHASFQLSLLELTGKVVLAKARFSSAYTLSLKQFASGTYILKVENTRTGEQVQRIVVKQ